MQRQLLIERIITQVYGGKPSDDAEITFNFVNNILGDAIAAAAKQNYTESIKLDGIAYVNNSFYSTFKGLSITSDDSGNFLYNITLPQVPVGIGKNEGVSTVRFKKPGFVSQDAIPLSMNQVGYADRMRPIPNKILYWSEGNSLKVKTTLQLVQYTAIVKMVSGGDSTDLTSEINVPQDYFPMMVDYIIKQLLLERNTPQDLSNNAVDKPTKT